MDSVQRHLTLLSEEIDALEKPRHALVHNDPTLQKRATLMQSLKGVGPVLSVTRLAMLPELGTLGHKQIAALVGVAPYSNDSGRMKGKRSIAGGRAHVRAVLYMAALSASRCESPLQPFYKRLIDAGNPPKVALTACARKLLTWLNARLRDDPMNLPKPAV